MKFLFRCDATAELGGGHVMRCLTLARALSTLGHSCAFLARKGASDIVPALRQSGFVLRELAEGADEASAAAGERPDWVVIDSYASGVEAEAWMRAATGARILAIDDLANRARDCDVLLDQNLGRSTEDYSGLVPAGARILAGPRYALLRPEFAAAREPALARRAAGGPVRRILVSLGMTDVGGVTLPAVQAALAAAPHAIVDVAISSRAPSLAALRALSAERAKLRLHVDNADMCGLMIQADLAIGAAGSTSWERCCLGLPSIVLVLADNQRDGAAALSQAVAACLSDLSGLSRAIVDLLPAQARATMQSAAAALCDGDGADRVARELLSCGSPVLLRPAIKADCDAIWTWRNDPVARSASRNSEPIPLDSHRRWYAAALKEGRRILQVAERDGQGVGSVRFDPEDGDWRVSIAMAPEARGCGLGRAALGLACARLRETYRGARIVADIRADNIASQKIFEANGFAVTGQSGDWLHLQQRAMTAREFS